MAVLSLGFANCARADLSAGLVSFWPLDEIDGNTTPDYASSNVVNIVGSVAVVPSDVPTTVPGLFTNAFSFPSTLSYFTTSGTGVTPTGLPIFKSSGGYTVSMWVKAAPQTARYLYTEGGNGGNQIFLIQTGNSAGSNNKLDMFVRNDAGSAQLNHVVSTTVVFDGTWHHIAWEDNHGTCALYVDGKLDGTTFHYTPTGNYTLNVTTVGALIRNTVSTNTFTGSIDNVAVWNRILSQAEVQDFMSNSIPLSSAQSKPVVLSVSPSITNSLGDYPSTLTVNVVGANPISYQWYSNGVPLLDQTSNSLILAPLTEPGTNDFTVVTTNPLGAITNDIVDVILPDPSNNITSGLISYWPLDTIASATVVSSPDLYSRNDLVLFGTNGNYPTLVPGEYSDALTFDTNQLEYAVSAGGVPAFLSSNYTISFWVNGMPQTQARAFSESSTNNGTPLFSIATSTSEFLPYASIFIRNDAGTTLLNNVNSGSFVFDGTWHHLVWVDQNGTALLYVDGTLDPVSFSYKRTGTFSLNTTTIGGILRGAAPDHLFSGTMDEVAIWNRRLTYSEIQALQTETLPPSSSLVAPSIVSYTVQPPDPTNNLFVGDNITLTVLANGTGPLSYQWYKNGLSINPGINPSAVSNVLLITDAQSSDSGAYTVVVTNGDPVIPGGGAVTSSVVQLTVQTFTPVTSGVALQVDVDVAGSPNTQSGYQMYNTSLAGTPFTNGIRMTISGVGAPLADRARTSSPFVTNGPGLTQAQIYNDFIFANSTNVGSGVHISLSHLAPNTPYGVTIWSFDPNSGGNRISSWTELSSGTPVAINANYTFNGNVSPVADFDDTVKGVVTSSPSGTLEIQGVTVSAPGSFGTFVNGLRLVANPGPTINITRSGIVADGNFQIVLQDQYSNEPVSFQASSDLTPGSWKPVLNTIILTNVGTSVVAEIPVTTNRQFFRAVGH